jgi:signal peptidase I
MSQAVAAPQQSMTTQVKETIESILVAFILAFIFRAFVVEAFVIPTGSMASTLLGAHMRFRCPDCGYTFDVNYSSHDRSDDMNFPSADFPPDDVYCPNCGYHVAAVPRRGPDGQIMIPFGAERQPVRYGDRILVLKYAYLLHPPRRWNVVVFKSPAEPEENHYTQNYIKRLVGEPGETLMVLDGDIYVQDPAGKWQIQRKPADVQDALWRIIYDNDFYPQKLNRDDRGTPWTQPWQPVSGQGWDQGKDASDGRVFRFSSQTEGAIGFNSLANAGTQTTNDYLTYDLPMNQRRPNGAQMVGGDSERNPVADLKLQFWYQRGSGQGSLKATLSKRDHTFVAEITPDSVTLFHTHPDGTTTTDGGTRSITGNAPVWVEFSNVDYKVTLKLNGREVFATTPDQYSPDVDRLIREFHGELSPPNSGPPRIEISAADQTCDISHLSLWRDIYYTNYARGTSEPMIWAIPGRPVHLHRAGEKREDGGGVYDDDEYFVMGDNSFNSSDARFWSDPIDLPHESLDMQSGRVPGRFILGKAFFVYWPSGYRPAPGWPPIIPDFGDMRFIH